MRVKVWKLLGLLFIMVFALSAANSVHAQGVTTTITVGSQPVGIAYDPNMHELFVANYVSGDIMVISDNNNTVIADITALTQYAGAPWDLAYDSAKGEMFLTDGTGVYVINDTTNAVAANITVPWASGGCLNIAYDSGKGEMFVLVSLPPGGLVSVISDTTNTLIENITSIFPSGMVYDSAKGEIFASQPSEFGAGDVAVMSDNAPFAILTTIPVVDPGTLAYDSVKGEIFVGNGTGVSVISDSSNKVVANINVGYAGQMVYDSGKGAIYVNGVNETFVISDTTNAVVGTVNTGFTSPGGLAYDSGMGEIFAVNSPGETSGGTIAPGTVAVISDSIVPEFSSAALILTLLFVASAVVLVARKLPRRRIRSACVTN